MKHLKLDQADEILDVSAGTGLLAEEIVSESGPFKKLVLNDPSQKMLEIAKYRMRYVKRVEFTSYFAENLRFEDQSFSKIICLNAFHYYTDQQKVVAHILRILKPGGTFYLLDWNRIGFFIILNRVIKMVSKDYINTRNLEELKKLMTEHSFIVRKHKEWRFRWWNFCFLACTKPKS